MTDISGATKLFTELLDAELITPVGSQNPTTPTNTRTHLHFTRVNGEFGAAELARAAQLAHGLGTSLHVHGA